MALNHSPSIVTNGLVFAYDMANTKKSWKGQPTVNILSSSGLDAALERSGTSYPFVSTNITTYVLANWSASNNKLSMSFEGKRDYVSGGTGGGADGYPVMYIYFSDWTWASAFGISTYDWSYGKQENITMPDPTGKTIYFSVYHMNAGNPGKSYSRNHQIEFNSYATPFVAGTRSTTQALVDLTNNNTITATSLTYASDGTFSFNGSSNKMTNVVSAAFVPSTNTIGRSWEVVVKPGASMTAAGIFGHVLGAGCTYFCNGGICIESGQYKFNWYDNAAYQFLASGVTATNGQYAHIIGTFDPSDLKMRIYVNGTLMGTSAATNLNYGNAANEYQIGYLSASGNSYTGKIDVCRYYYNRSLSAAEVQQNFNALRGRYGI